MEHTPQKELELDVDALLAEPFKAWDPTTDLAFTPYKPSAASPNCSTATPASTWAPTPHDSVWTPQDKWAPVDPVPAALASLDATERLHVCSQLQQCAEAYAVAKKAHTGQDLDAALTTMYEQLAANLGEDVVAGESADVALRGLVGKFVPEYSGEATSIGSLPMIMGRERDARPCRFFPKGKCFDGVLCRFSHAPEPRNALHNITNELCKLSPGKGSSPTRRGSRGAGSARRKKESRGDNEKLRQLLGPASYGYGDRKRLDTRPDKLATLFSALKASGGVDPQPNRYPLPSQFDAQEWWQAYAQAYNDAATAHAHALIAGLNAAPTAEE